MMHYSGGGVGDGRGAARCYIWVSLGLDLNLKQLTHKMVQYKYITQGISNGVARMRFVYTFRYRSVQQLNVHGEQWAYRIGNCKQIIQ